MSTITFFQNKSMAIARLRKVPELHADFLKKQREVLEQYQLGYLVPTSFSQSDLDNTFLLTYFDQGEMVGGIKIHCKTQAHALPAESVMEKFPQNSIFRKKIEKGKIIGVTESCSLWVATKHKGKHLASKMIRTAADFSSNLGYGLNLGFIGPALPCAIRAGAVLDKDLEPVQYPCPPYRSRIVWVFKESFWPATNNFFITR